MIVLGINAYHADSSAAILRNGIMIAATEEERFSRVKHWAGFPYFAQYLFQRKRTERKWVAGPYTPQIFLYGWMPPHPTFLLKNRFMSNLGALI